MAAGFVLQSILGESLLFSLCPSRTEKNNPSRSLQHAHVLIFIKLSLSCEENSVSSQDAKFLLLMGRAPSPALQSLEGAVK